MSNQPVISFGPLPGRRAPFSPRQTSLLKRGRAITTTAVELILLPYRCYIRKTRFLKSTNSFLFTGIYPLYTREVINNQSNKIRICYSQLKY
jgi:hypothetical protein